MGGRAIPVETLELFSKRHQQVGQVLETLGYSNATASAKEARVLTRASRSTLKVVTKTVTNRVVGCVSGLICAGCGMELPPGAGLGRPARFHNDTCRQRAHRARRAARHADVLAALGEVEAAVSELRRVVVLAQRRPNRETAARLARATGELLGRLDEPTPALAGELPEAERPVTKPVTIPGPAAADARTAREPTSAPSGSAVSGHVSVGEPGAYPSRPAAPDSVTEAVMKPGAGDRGGARRPRRGGRGRPRPARPEPLDLDTVRLERGTAGGWRVLAGLARDPGTVIRVGVLEPAYGTGRRTVKGWYAADDHLLRVPGGPWRTRQDATVHLMTQHQRTAGATP